MRKKPSVLNNLNYFKKLFFSLKNTNEIHLNLRLTENGQKVKKLRLAKIKLTAHRVVNRQLLSQKSSNYLAHFFKNSVNEVDSRLLLKNPLGQNNLLFDPENLWNNFVGIKQEKLSTFYLISKYPSAKYPGMYHIARNKKFKRTNCRSFHINDLIFRMWINRQYSISNFYNKERRFSFHYAEELLNYSKKITWYGLGYGDFVSSLEEAFSIAATELQFLIYRSKTLLKKLLVGLIKKNNLLAKNTFNHLPFLIYTFSAANLEYQDKFKLITLPGNFEIETPFTYKARKFGRQSIKSQITAISETREYSFPFPLNLRTKRGLYSGEFSGQYFNQNFSLKPNQTYYHEWWKTIALHKSDVGLNRQYALFPNITSSPIISKKDILFQTLFENKSFYPNRLNSSSLIKGKRVENYLVQQFAREDQQKTKNSQKKQKTPKKKNVSQ